MMSGNAPQKLGSVLHEVIDSLGLRRRIDEARAIEAWAVLAGHEINAATRRVWMEGATLHVQLTSSTRRHHLHMNRSRLRDELNEALGSPLVSEIRFR